MEFFLFALQIYFDFSGYSDMLWSGKMFGFSFKENFDYPYISKKRTEFWRRWNISVGGFFRDLCLHPARWQINGDLCLTYLQYGF